MIPTYTPLDANPGLSAQFSVNYNDVPIAASTAKTTCRA